VYAFRLNRDENKKYFIGSKKGEGKKNKLIF
jgi:hypothetical protein